MDWRKTGYQYANVTSKRKGSHCITQGNELGDPWKWPGILNPLMVHRVHPINWSETSLASRQLDYGGGGSQDMF